MRNHFGISFIEVLVSLAILSSLLLGLELLQVSILREVKAQYYFNRALFQLNVMADYLESNNSDLSKKITWWNKQNQKLLPQGRGVIFRSSSSLRLAIFWGGLSETSCHKNKIGIAGCLYL